MMCKVTSLFSNRKAGDTGNLKNLSNLNVMPSIERVSLINPVFYEFYFRYDHMYTLEIRLTDTKNDSKFEIVRSYTSWYDEDGNLRQDLLEPVVTKLHDSLLTEKKEK